MRVPLLACALLSTLLPNGLAQVPLDTELLIDGDFEAPTLAAWSTSGSMELRTYGATNAPGSAVSIAIGGGIQLVSDLSGNSHIWQTIDISGNSADVDAGLVNLRLAGDLGGLGGDKDNAKLRVRFLEAAGGEISSEQIDPVLRHHRNHESVVTTRVEDFTIPALTRSLEVRLEASYVSAPTRDGMADNLSAMLTALPIAAALPLDVNLMVNGDFEGGSVPGSFLELDNPGSWLPLSATLLLEDFGAVGNPSFACGATLGGGTHMLRSNTGNTVMTQTFDVTGNATAIDAGALYFEFGGDLGGRLGDSDTFELEATFRNSVGGFLGTATIDPVTKTMRNKETVLLRTLRTAAIPTLTREIEVKLINSYISASVVDALADNIVARLVAPPAPSPQPLDTELVTNGGFESGYEIGSFHNPENLSAWRPNAVTLNLESYGGGVYPDLATGSLIGGGAVMLHDVSGNSRMSQTLDVTGNAGDIDAGLLWLHYGAHLGGQGADKDRMHFDATFLDVAGATISTDTTDYVSSDNRMSQTTLLRRERHISVPPGTRTMVLELASSYLTASVPDGVADNASALLTLSPPAPIAVGTELLLNGDFESGSLLSPASVDTWLGSTSAVSQIEQYGSGSTPSVGDAALIGGGAYLAGDVGGNSHFETRLDLRGNAAAVDLSTMNLRVSAFLGGVGADADYCQVDITCFNGIGGVLTTATVGPVLAADRANVTALLYRFVDVSLPIFTREILIDVRMKYVTGPVPDALIDNVSAVLTNSLGSPGHYPGTSEDVILLTGINGAVSTGPLFDIKTAQEGSQLDVSILSPTGSFDYSPLMLAADVGLTGQFPMPIPIPGIALSGQGFTMLVDGTTFGGGFGAQLLLPGGSFYSFHIPHGLAGNSVILQAFIFPSDAPFPFLPAPAGNGVFASTNAHEIIVIP